MAWQRRQIGDIRRRRCSFRARCSAVEVDQQTFKWSPLYQDELLQRYVPEPEESETLVAATPPAFLHLVHEALPVVGAGCLGGLRSIAAVCRIGVATDMLPRIDGGHCRRDHDHKAKNAEEWVDRNTCDEEAETSKKPDTSKCRATPMNSPHAGPPQRVDQLGILGRQRGFHLLEKPLLLI